MSHKNLQQRYKPFSFLAVCDFRTLLMKQTVAEF